jgi:DNA-directed RNA polymerase beta subunit
MQVLDQNILNSDIATIQLLHSRLAEDLSKSFAYHTGGQLFLANLNKRNILISKYIEILYRYQVIGDVAVTEYYNVLTVNDIQSIIDDAYRELDRYNYERSSNTTPIVTTPTTNTVSDMAKYTITQDLVVGNNIITTTLTYEPYNIEFIDSDGIVITKNLGDPIISLVGGIYVITVYSSDAIDDVRIKIIY